MYIPTLFPANSEEVGHDFQGMCILNYVMYCLADSAGLRGRTLQPMANAF